MSINREMDKDVVHMYNEILLSHKKEQNNAICRNMDGSRDCHSEWSWTKTNIIWYRLYVESKEESEVAQPYLTLCNPMDCSLPGSSVHGIFQARELTGVGCYFLLQSIFPTQGSNPGLPHCRQTLYCLRHQGCRI